MRLRLTGLIWKFALLTLWFRLRRPGKVEKDVPEARLTEDGTGDF
jgi:hypothetical protein